MARTLAATISTGRTVPCIERHDDPATGLTKIVLRWRHGPAPVTLFYGPTGAEGLAHAWWALDLVARAFEPDDDVIGWVREREIEEGEGQC